MILPIATAASEVMRWKKMAPARKRTVTAMKERIRNKILKEHNTQRTREAHTTYRKTTYL